MVSRRLFFFVCLLVAGCAASTGCGAIDRPESSSNVISSGSRPFVLSAEPDSAAGGDAVTVTGRGFSYVAPENVVSVGGTAQVANTFDISEDGTESLVFTMPDDAAEGETTIIVITEGR